MAETPANAVVEPTPAEPQQATPQKNQQNAKPKRQPPYAVILHNDDVNMFEHVINVLQKVFRYEQTKAIMLTTEAHHTGRSIVWSGVLEVAELKADQIRSCGPDPERKKHGALSLRVSVEPLPQ
jgi:ATP-dependent Clp protease adaptor protein ClpS